MAAPVRVLVWDEGSAPAAVYPRGLGAAVADGLAAAGLDVLGVAGPGDPDQGTAAAALAEAEVLVWWSHHGTAKSLTDRAADRVARAVRERGLGFVALHSAYLGKPFRLLLGADAGIAGGGDDGSPERITVAAPDHPIAAGIEPFVLEREEFYLEPFRVPEPEAVVLTSEFPGHPGPFRSGMAWTVGAGRIVYFRPGHETCPTYAHPLVRKIVANAARWTARRV